MEATKITATELARNLSDILNRVRYKGEHFLVIRNGEEIARLDPRPEHPKMTLGEMVEIIRNAPSPDPDYWKDVEEARRLMNQPLEPPAWDC
jgi:prevent-host-death family protein